MTKTAAFLTLVLLAGVQLLQADKYLNPATLSMPTFLTSGFPARYSKWKQNWLVPGAAGIRGYTVTCVINAESGPMENLVAVADVRPRQASRMIRRQQQKRPPPWPVSRRATPWGRSTARGSPERAAVERLQPTAPLPPTRPGNTSSANWSTGMGNARFCWLPT